MAKIKKDSTILKEYDHEHGPTPLYNISKQLADLTKMFIISSVTFFLIAGSLAIIMRMIQSDLNIMGNQQQTMGLFYAALTAHGQIMFFGFASMMTVGLSYYLVSKFAKKPLYSFKIAIISYVMLNSGNILLIVSAIMFFGGGWYNLLPLAFHPQNDGWTIFSSILFLLADTLIAIGLTIFCINIVATVLKGKIAAGVQKNESEDNSFFKAPVDLNDSGRVDLLPMENLSPAIRWVSILGISSWFPRKYRKKVPAVSIVVVGIFVNAVALLSGSIGFFTQLAIGFTYLLNPNFEPNWLFAKDAWWFFGHPIVYFTLFSFLAAAYYYIPKFTKKTVPYDKWAYRPWPFYFIFTVMVFSHHSYMDMPNPIFAQIIATIASQAIIFPSGLTIMTIMMYILRSNIRWNISSFFIVSGIIGWVYGGFTGAETGWWGTDVYLHNTLNIVGHIHLVLLMGSILLGIGLIYALIADLTKKKLGNILGLIHLLTTLIGGFGLALMFTYLGFLGFIRREAVIPDQFSWALPWLLFFALTVGIGQIIFAFNLGKTLIRKQKPEEYEFVKTQEKRSIEENLTITSDDVHKL
ncbi:MAG: cbb3-type cytochrome c oxidase subunit I [Nitrososphaeraceae archaeon]